MLRQWSLSKTLSSAIGGTIPCLFEVDAPTQNNCQSLVSSVSETIYVSSISESIYLAKNPTRPSNQATLEKNNKAVIPRRRTYRQNGRRLDSSRQGATVAGVDRLWSRQRVKPDQLNHRNKPESELKTDVNLLGLAEITASDPGRLTL